MRLGIDIGGTKIEAAALGDDGAIRLRRRLPTPSGDYPGIIATVKALVTGIEAEAGPAESIGVGIPGMLSPATGLVKNANSTCLIGRPFDRDLAAALGRPVRLANDANCFALSEAVDGAAQGARVVFGVILGTGVGGPGRRTTSAPAQPAFAASLAPPRPSSTARASAAPMRR